MGVSGAAGKNDECLPGLVSDISSDESETDESSDNNNRDVQNEKAERIAKKLEATRWKESYHVHSLCEITQFFAIYTWRRH